VADLRVDYQLLASVTSTLSNLAAEFAHIGDQVSGYDPAYGSGAITVAMGNFSGNWSNHRKTLLAEMGNLGSWPLRRSSASARRTASSPAT
jgi:hypothetical protein